MRHKITILLSIIILLISLPLSAVAKQASNTVLVDCNKGHSIMAALENKADELTIEILGVCEENVYVGRPNVTLRGISIAPYNFPNPPDPLEEPVDGIHGLDDANTLFVAGMNGSQFIITIENLVLSGGNFSLGINYAIAWVNNVKLEGSSYGGAVVGIGSRVGIYDSLIFGPRAGLAVGGAANRVQCTRCTIVQSVSTWGNAVAATNASYVDLIDSEVRGRNALFTSNSRITVSGSASVIESVPRPRGNPPALPGFGTGILATDGSTVEVEGAALFGPVQARGKSMVSLNGVVHSTPDTTYLFTSHVDEDSTLLLEGASFDKSLDLSGFSNAILRGAAHIADDLNCS